LKTIFFILLSTLLVIGLTACGTPTAATITSFVDTEVPAVVEFTDPVLDATVRAAIGQPEGGITLDQAQSVKRLDLNDELQGYLSQEPLIENISGLEAFTNLESLDLSGHAVSDISPLQGLTNLTALSLAGNPVADVSPLAGLINLKVLVLSGSQAEDYSVIANLVNLQVLMLDNSTLSDLAPLAGLTNLHHLDLANSSVEDLTLIESIYSNLTDKDFIIATTLAELGFILDENSRQAIYDTEEATFTIHHAAWGSPAEEWHTNTIRTSMYTESGHKVLLGYYGNLNAYVFMIHKEGEPFVNYVYDAKNGSLNIAEEDRARTEQVMREVFEVMEGEDPLLAPMRIFRDLVKDTFGMTAEKLYALPYAPPTLKNLGFHPDEANAVYLFEQRGERDVNMEVHRPEWGEREHDVRFNTPLREGYRIVVTWHAAERKFIASADDDYQGGASFEYYLDTGEYLDIWCSYKDKTVEEYFIKAYNDPTITDVYQHSIEMMVQYVSETFGMTIEELYALPTGE